MGGMVSEQVPVDVTGDDYRAKRAEVKGWDRPALARRAQRLLHRREVYGLDDAERVELQAVVDESQVRGGGLLA